MNQFRQRLQQLAETDIAVWFYGEHGTGRMTGARYLHQLLRSIWLKTSAAMSLAR
ncbi:phosphoglycerate transport activator [Salmonella enterica subsp. indica serovar 6,14,25:z10:1,(2),7 str. 1121]|uniref:Phosphoglycerate transport activator n=1 Tax=Salmonella enterica subsp. indica serovar 6,14,25:z10:1,(2),7 str. 1121 TaxID=1173950 RepID=V1H4C8_SALER|nr:phosphoglycerate transport activator [Salmonella enterica subsp. indica serovar 6,14,25:z10:1,(2),7 str. 1121]